MDTANGKKNPKPAGWLGRMDRGSDIEDIKFACGPRHPILFDISSNSLRWRSHLFGWIGIFFQLGPHIKGGREEGPLFLFHIRYRGRSRSVGRSLAHGPFVRKDDGCLALYSTASLSPAFPRDVKGWKRRRAIERCSLRSEGGCTPLSCRSLLSPQRISDVGKFMAILKWYSEFREL